MARLVDGLVAADPGQFNGFFGTQAVEFNPGIFPGDFPVRNISAYLVWEHHKTLAAFYLVGDGLPSGIFCN